MKSDKTVSANSKGIVICYGDNKKHMFSPYRNSYVKKIQLDGSANYQRTFNPTQEKLYSKIMYGFSYYEDRHIAKMSNLEKKNIKTNYTIAHKLLNRWKQEIINELVDGFLLKLFPKSTTAKKMVSVKGYDDDFECTISFKDLGISETAIANKLVEFNLLPKNFFNLV